MSLLSQIQKLPRGTKLWVDDTGLETDRNGAMALASLFRQRHPEIRNKTVAIVVKAPMASVRALCALDGFAAALMMFDLDEFKRAPKPVARLGADFLVTDDDDLCAPERLQKSGVRATPVRLTHQSGPVPEATDDVSEVEEVATSWVVPTSGTTAQPKLVGHSLASLSRAVKSDHRKGADIRWGLLYNLNRFAGIQVFLQALMGGSLLVFPAPDGDLSKSVRGFAKVGINALSATPTLWRKLLMVPASEDLDLVRITLGGEIADGSVLKSLASRYPGARVVHIYASTEAGVGFSVKDGLPGFPATMLQEAPLVDVRVRDDGMLLLRPKGQARARYHNADENLEDHEGFIETGDLVELKEDRYLFLGRENGSINVGGNKVHPEEVERTILQVDGVAMASVGARKSPFTGTLVQAQVVAHPDHGDPSTLPETVMAHCKRHLAPFKVPVKVLLTDAIETSASGKVTRGKL